MLKNIHYNQHSNFYWGEINRIIKKLLRIITIIIYSLLRSEGGVECGFFTFQLDITF